MEKPKKKENRKGRCEERRGDVRILQSMGLIISIIYI